MTDPAEPEGRPGWVSRCWRAVNRYAIQIIGIVVLILTGFTAVLSIQQGSQTRAVAAEGRDLASAVNRIQTEALCPLFALFLRAYHPERQPADQLEFYETAFTDLRRMNAVLRCPTPK